MFSYLSIDAAEIILFAFFAFTSLRSCFAILCRSSSLSESSCFSVRGSGESLFHPPRSASKLPSPVLRPIIPSTVLRKDPARASPTPSTPPWSCPVFSREAGLALGFEASACWDDCIRFNSLACMFPPPSSPSTSRFMLSVNNRMPLIWMASASSSPLSANSELPVLALAPLGDLPVSVANGELGVLPSALPLAESIEVVRGCFACCSNSCILTATCMGST
mmetsp:Transcript_40358/g.82579  ORF Transcript_40358/g.82579 Transcript_40358/m.82579 type:complete len:221 (-) Transcript_40358:1160-1822(-)